MPAWRCTDCGISWPARVDSQIRPPLSGSYQVCPQCEEECDPIAEDGIDMATARRLKLECEFERFYAARPSAREVDCAAA